MDFYWLRTEIVFIIHKTDNLNSKYILKKNILFEKFSFSVDQNFPRLYTQVAVKAIKKQYGDQILMKSYQL